MPAAPQLIVWDFDGVLNANIREGRFVWADRVEADLGIDKAAFSEFVFQSGLIREVVTGDRDLLEVVRGWLIAQGHEITAEAFLDYWFEKEALPDHEVIGWMEAHPARRVIGTNNETRRSRYIEEEMGFAARVDHLFSSGRLGVAKPDAGFFAAIERWSGLTPAQILLIDDAPANVAAATRRGWQGFHFTPRTRADLPVRLGLT